MKTAAPNDRLLVTMTAAELEQLVDARVRAGMRDEIEKLVEPRFLTTAEVADMLSISTVYVARLVKSEGLPVARQLGRELRFERDRVVEWMRARSTPAPAPTDRPRLSRKHLTSVK